MSIRREVWCALSIIGEAPDPYLWFGPWGRSTFDVHLIGYPSYRKIKGLRAE